MPMKNILMKKAAIVMMLLVSFIAVSAQTYKYDTVPGDPLKARIYKLSNGLTVYMSVYKNAPRIHTYLAVRAGSKNDPADATGLAHYLEHMLFKGTDKFGTLDFAKEKPMLDKIEDLYETYRVTTDEAQRKKLYAQIDSVSGVAAKYAIANEYDKMVAALGSKASNAYTSVEQTVYICDIPSNQLEKWLTLEAERLRKPVMRIFHTELEAVYEEKNRSLDSDDDKVWETLFLALFPNHQYGTQTTIGTIDHLKNPSIKKIREYYDQYYVPNNIALCLSGDFDPDLAIRLIDQKFSVLQEKPVIPFVAAKEEPLTKSQTLSVIGPDAESVTIGYRLPGAASPETDVLKIFDKILFNRTAGLIDLNLNQKQAILEGGSIPVVMKDYSSYILFGQPKTGQTLDEVKSLLLSQIELIKKGEFPDWMVQAAITDLKAEQVKSFEDNSRRADAFVDAYILGLPWETYVQNIARLEKVTKQQVIDFSKKYFGDNYVAVNKKTGEDKNVQKVVKPAITPVEVNREAKSPFLQKLVETPSSAIEPVFIDYKKDIVSLKGKSSLPILYKKNEENKLFDLIYYYDFGSNNDPKLPMALEYLNLIGTSKLTPAQLQQEFYKLGCTFSVYPSDEQIYMQLSGLAENQEKAVALFEELLNSGRGDKDALASMVENILKEREDAKLSKNTILWQAMYNYGVYGPKNPFTNILSEQELKALTPDDLLGVVKKLSGYEHKMLYYGPQGPEELMAQLNKLHKTAAQLAPAPAAKGIVEQENPETTVYVVDYDMKQAEILMLSKSDKLNKTLFPQISLFSEYFGGGMASIVFQTLRESKALAYSTFATYNRPKSTERSHYVMAYIGTQADKLPEAMAGMNELLNELPKSENLFSASKDAVIQKIRTERITKGEVLLSYVRNTKMGIDYDFRKDVYVQVPDMSFEDVKGFHTKYFRDKKYNIMVLGKKELLDIKTLEKYGKVKYLSLTDVFGY